MISDIMLDAKMYENSLQFS